MDKNMDKVGVPRVFPVRCMAVPDGSRRCRVLTKNPNCHCGVHQSLTKVPRFETVVSVDECAVGVRTGLGDDYTFSAEEVIERQMLALTLRKDVLHALEELKLNRDGH